VLNEESLVNVKFTRLFLLLHFCMAEREGVELMFENALFVYDLDALKSCVHLRVHLINGTLKFV
jgi:hypothetical protein